VENIFGLEFELKIEFDGIIELFTFNSIDELTYPSK
jgi:hypothetical protein